MLGRCNADEPFRRESLAGAKTTGRSGSARLICAENGGKCKGKMTHSAARGPLGRDGRVHAAPAVL
jgi:hypothetical protein